MLRRGAGVRVSRLDGRAAEEGGAGTQQSQGPPHSLTLVTRGLLLDHGQRGPGGRSAQRVAPALLDLHFQLGKGGRILKQHRRPLRGQLWGQKQGLLTGATAQFQRTPESPVGGRRPQESAVQIRGGCSTTSVSLASGMGATGPIWDKRDHGQHTGVGDPPASTHCPFTCPSLAPLSSSGPVSSMGVACSFQVGPFWAKCSEACWQDTRPLLPVGPGRGTTYSMGMTGRGFASGSSPGALGGTTLRGGGRGLSSAASRPGAGPGMSSKGASSVNWEDGGGGSSGWWGCREP